MTREGGCLCGAVRFKAEGEPINVRLCHCRNCQKAMGSPFFARALFPQTALTVQGETDRYPTSERLDRVFCKKCGTRLFTWRKDGSAAGVALAVFDDRHAFAPTEHIWTLRKDELGQPRRRLAAISGRPAAHDAVAARVYIRLSSRSLPLEHFRLPAFGLGAAADHRHHLSRGRARLRRASARRRHRL